MSKGKCEECGQEREVHLTHFKEARKRRCNPCWKALKATLPKTQKVTPSRKEAKHGTN